jgi:hypothetical protein
MHTSVIYDFTLYNLEGICRIPKKSVAAIFSKVLTLPLKGLK